jgi:DNA-binding MarR family transcriptional regulator
MEMREVRADQLRRVIQRLLRDFGALAADATPCGHALSMVHAHALMALLSKGALSQQELGAELRIDKSNVARLCAKMAEAGHVEQRASDRDGRSRIVALTPPGKRLAREVDAASRERFGALLKALPSQRQAVLIEALEQLVIAIESLSTSTLEKDVR